MFALSLDDYSYTLPASHRTPDADLASHLHNVRSGHGDRPGHNRWYDKPFTLIVEANTRAGVLGEHSPVDALVPSIIADYAIVQNMVEDEFSSIAQDDTFMSGSPPNAVVGGWTRLDWVTDDTIAKECEGAAARAKAIVDDSDADELVFDAYGTEWIKNEGMCDALLADVSACRLTFPCFVPQRASRLTDTFRWRCSLRGTAHAASSPRRTKLPSRVSSTMAVPRQSARSPQTAARGSSQWRTPAVT